MDNGLGERLRDARKDKKLTQEEVAEKIGVTTTTIQNWEKGKYIPKEKYWNKIEEIYTISPEEMKKWAARSKALNKNNWPYFLFFDDGNELAERLHLSRDELEVFAFIYREEDWENAEWHLTHRVQEMKISCNDFPDNFINEKRWINILKMFDQVKLVLYEVSAEFLMRWYKENPESEFNILQLPKDEICRFLIEGHSEHIDSETMDPDLKDPVTKEIYSPLYYFSGFMLKWDIEMLRALNKSGGRIYWRTIKDSSEYFSTSIGEGKLHCPVCPKELEDVMEKWWKEHPARDIGFTITSKFVSIRKEKVGGKEKVYIEINELGEKFVEWYKEYL